MAARKAPAEKATKPTSAKKAAKRAVAKPPKKQPAPKPAKKAAPRAKPAQAAAVAKPKAAPTRRPPDAPRVQKTRVVIATSFYEPNKDAIKAPFKDHGLKWNYLGAGKGLYKRPDNGVHCFTQFQDDGVHYSIWGDDKPVVEKILGVWRGLLGEEAWTRATASGEQAAAEEKAEKESDAMRLWRLSEPQRRPGEPDLFFDKRVAEWQAKRPA